MGQYYLVANMDKQEYMECIGSLKLMEWSYNRNEVVLTMEDLMAKRWKGDHIYVIGDYAGSEQGCAHTEVLRKLEKELLQGRTDISLYGHICNQYKKIKCENNRSNYRYIYNHQTKSYVDMEHCPLDTMLGAFNDHGKWYHATIAPLPLLLALGNGLGLGDYHGNNEKLVGSWAKDSDKLEICENMKYRGYKELKPDFYEGELVPYTEKEKRIQIAKQYFKARNENRSR